MNSVVYIKTERWMVGVAADEEEHGINAENWTVSADGLRFRIGDETIAWYLVWRYFYKVAEIPKVTP